MCGHPHSRALPHIPHTALGAGVRPGNKQETMMLPWAAQCAATSKWRHCTLRTDAHHHDKPRRTGLLASAVGYTALQPTVHRTGAQPCDQCQPAATTLQMSHTQMQLPGDQCAPGPMLEDCLPPHRPQGVLPPTTNIWLEAAVKRPPTSTIRSWICRPPSLAAGPLSMILDTKMPSLEDPSWLSFG